MNLGGAVVEHGRAEPSAARFNRRRAPARRVVVTGHGAITPFGHGAGTLIDRWLAGECAIQEGEARCEGFDPTIVLSSREARRTDRFTQLALAALAEAWDAAGWDEAPPYAPERIGCVIGTAFGGIETMEKSLAAGGAPAPLAIPTLLTNAATAAICIRRTIMGPTFPVTSTCSAGADAIALGQRLIQTGLADAVIAGASEAPFTPFVQQGLAAMRATSTVGISRPFDARRDGFVLGEGAAVLVLEAAETAAARDAVVVGEILGSALVNDAHHITMPAEDGRGVSAAMRSALDDAGLAAGDVAYVNAHGTSTPLNDRVETIGIKRALGAHAANVPVSSAKSVIGHLMGAAGAVEAVATLEALRRGLAPPTVGYEEPEEGLDLDYVPDAPRPLMPAEGAGPLVGVSNSAGFGGHNSALCLGVSGR